MEGSSTDTAGTSFDPLAAAAARQPAPAVPWKPEDETQPEPRLPQSEPEQAAAQHAQQLWSWSPAAGPAAGAQMDTRPSEEEASTPSPPPVLTCVELTGIAGACAAAGLAPPPVGTNECQRRRLFSGGGAFLSCIFSGVT